MEQKILFIGLGTMGAPMAKNILEKGFDVAMCDIDRNVVNNFKEIVSIASTKPSEAADQRNVIVMMLPNSDVVNAVLFSEGGALETCASNSLFVDMSTGSYPKMMKIAKRVTGLGHRFVDAPVGRTPREAITGDLLVMAGGDLSDIESLRNVFDAIANKIVHVGPVGSGLKTKLVNNYMAMINNAVTAEALSFAHRVGLDIDVTAELMSSTTAGLGQLNTNYTKKVLANDLSPDFPITMAIKDLDMAIELANSFESERLFGDLAKKLFIDAEKVGMGKLDQTAILTYLLNDQ